ncbi:MAG: DUF5690 family protein [Gemmataceae bacterium]
MNPPLAPPSSTQPRLTDELRVAAWAVVAAFGCYFCMYAFRKPFTAADYAGSHVGGLDFKVVLVTLQVTGYMLSKFLGIRVIAEMPPQRRALGILVLVGLAEIALLLFALVPRPWNAIFLFLNGLPLGMVFGLVLGFLEGRRATEALTAGLCASFILADGATKTVGAWLLSHGVPEDWMPAVAGLLFALPLILCVAMLQRVPAPTPLDVAHRSPRTSMTAAERNHLLRRYALGLVPLVMFYLVVTILRSIRADFAPELWQGLGSAAQPVTFTMSEMIVALGVLLVNGAAVLIYNNRVAFFASLATCALGVVCLTIALTAWLAGQIDPFLFMVVVGLGLYLPYVAIHTTVFERMLAITRERGNLGFLLYVADAVGYLGYVVVMLVRNFAAPTGDLLSFFLGAAWLTVILASVCLMLSLWFFARLESTHPSQESMRGVA